MNWLTSFVRPKIRSLVGKDDVPDNLWKKCPGCEQMLFHKDLETSFEVCSHCGHHQKLDTGRRITLLFDPGTTHSISLPTLPQDPLKFKDTKRYTDRLKTARNTTGQQEALSAIEGKIGGYPVVAAFFDFAFMGGSMGTAVGEGLACAINVAVQQKVPFIVVPSSGGARMQEGILSLMQMPKTVAAVNRLKRTKKPYIVLFSNPTTGGVLASFATLGDIHMAEPGATIGFAGARVIQETMRHQLPEGFQRSEYLLEHGLIDMVTPRAQQKEMLTRLLGLLQKSS
ncbi:MAG: acetyl-CoA carboxylase, carboxyltransferase subunit beta [Holosporales bacterium]|jgi:acetyl-CoA carboxylase carboxyl transferase subunit beta|nr:acetyl-CoA carboxylase, carboxyltransferase subunit beta [Holosporales bacterium]